MWAPALIAFLLLSRGVYPDEELENSIAQHMTGWGYNEFSAEKKVEEWGDGCIPILIQMLNASSGEAAKIAFYLGITKSPSAVQPLIDYVERLQSMGIRVRFGYMALGWIGDEKALDYLAQAAKAPNSSEEAVHSLGNAGNRQALTILEELKSTLSDSPPYLSYSITRLQETIEREEGLRRARSIQRDNPDDLLKFWKFQSAQLSKNPAEEIIGKYVGSAFWTDSFENSEFEGVRIIFREDGIFETNLGLLTNMKRLDRRDPAPTLLKDFVQGQYRVLSPTQLILGPGEGVTTYGFSLGDGSLSFYHRRLRAFISLSNNKNKPPVFTGTDIAGVYKGTAFVAEEGANQIKEVGGIEIVFSDNGYFSTNFGDKYGKLMRGIRSFDGEYLIDKYGKLVCYAKIHGIDFGGGDAVSFFNWHLRQGTLHLDHFQGAYYGCALALSLSPEAANLRNPEALERLTSGTYTGSAFRSTPEGRIIEIPGIEMQFSRDGIYRGIPSERLRPGQQYYPADNGPFVILSDRQLYMADRWDDGGLTNQGICDVLVSDDELFFTSLRRDAYFALKRKAQ